NVGNHEPNVKCISKGKPHKKYEFGNKVSLATTAKSSFIVGVKSFAENIFDGKTLSSAFEQIKSMINQCPQYIFVDRGYRGYTGKLEECNVYHQGQKRGVTKSIKTWLVRRSRIEPVIGHLKSDHRLDRNFLKGDTGDSINLILASAAFNFKRLLRVFLAYFEMLIFIEILSTQT
ncbi:transposase, partial [Dolichospermum sp. ST_sed1]|nr:transposase [Dolichospermum sp. ST_sed1]